MIDLRAAVAQTAVVMVLRSRTRFQFILSLLRELVIKVAEETSASLPQGPDGGRDLSFARTHAQPHDAASAAHREKKANPSICRFSAPGLLFLVILARLGLNGRQPLDNAGLCDIGNGKPSCLAFVMAGPRAAKYLIPTGSPKLHATISDSQVTGLEHHAPHKPPRVRSARGVANDAAPYLCRRPSRIRPPRLATTRCRKYARTVAYAWPPKPNRDSRGSAPALITQEFWVSRRRSRVRLRENSKRLRLISE